MKLIKLFVNRINVVDLRKIDKYINLLDIIGTLIGVIMIGIGLYMIYKPLMWIVIGLVLSFPGIPRKVVK